MQPGIPDLVRWGQRQPMQGRWQWDYLDPGLRARVLSAAHILASASAPQAGSTPSLQHDTQGGSTLERRQEHTRICHLLSESAMKLLGQGSELAMQHAGLGMMVGGHARSSRH